MRISLGEVEGGSFDMPMFQESSRLLYKRGEHFLKVGRTRSDFKHLEV